jgi:hypothetical protein
MTTSCVRIASAGVAAVVLSGCAIVPSQRASFREPTDVARLTRAAGGVTGLEIRVGVGDLRLVAGAADSLAFAVALRSQDAKRLGEICIPRSELIAEPDGTRLVVRLEQRSRDRCGEVWQVQVPATMPVAVHAAGGKVVTERLAGGLTVRITGSGHVDASVTGGPVDARVGVGDVRVVSGEPSYRSVSLTAEVGRVTLETAGMRISPPSRGAGATFGSEGKGDHDIRLRSRVGDVTLVLATPRVHQ